MIVVKLRGGLGNQLFQYAAARALSLRHTTSIKLDCDWFVNRPATDTARTYMLGNFAIASEFATERDILETRYKVAGRKMYFLSPLFACFGNKEWGWYRQRYFQYDPAVLELGANSCLDGYWQSPKYFQDYEDQIRKEFRITKNFSGEKALSAELISSSLSAAVHIRRGDYANNPETVRVHGICSLIYYRQAMELLADKFDNISFFIFSDEPEWAMANLDFQERRLFFINSKHEDACEDLHLMALCKHHIIANSTFSWWGAWLGKKDGQIVIAPRKWFNDPTINTDDLIPSGWFRL